jgi:hypothetical protein
VEVLRARGTVGYHRTDGLHHFLGIIFSRSSSALFLSQCQYILDLLSRAGMTECQSCRTSADNGAKLSADGDPVPNSTLYRSITGALQYATPTRPDISYSVQQACLFMHNFRITHLAHVKRILRYLSRVLLGNALRLGLRVDGIL